MKSLPLEGSETATAVLNYSPVGCKTRGVTEPQRDRGTALAVDEVQPRAVVIKSYSTT